MTKICKNCGHTEDWQDISTAPKTGEEILVCNMKQGGVLTLINWDTIHKYWKSKGELVLHNQADYWMSIPKCQKFEKEIKPLRGNRIIKKTKKQPKNHSPDSKRLCSGDAPDENKLTSECKTSGTFNLSKERTFAEGFEGRKWFYYEEDVKEFIRLLKLKCDKITDFNILNEIDKLSGEHLRC